MTETNVDYKAAYERQKKARAMAEDLLESRSRELYDANQSLQYAYNKLKNQKQQIIHQEKLASLGQLSAGIAHEINNPAGYVKSNLDTLKTYSRDFTEFFNQLDNLLENYCTKNGNECPPESEILLQAVSDLKKSHEVDFLLNDIAQIVVESHDGIGRIESIVKGLRDFSRPDNAEPLPFDVTTCIENTLRLVATQLKHALEVICELDADLIIKGQQGSLSQVFLNLMVNAMHAVTEKHKSAADGQLRISAYRKDKFAMISFTDNGCGMSNEIKDKIFDPFFSTKKHGKGTGLGLAISHGIIKTHGGIIMVNSEPGEWTEFVVQLPLVDFALDAQ